MNECVKRAQLHSSASCAEENRMATKVARTGVQREKGWLYYLDKKGHVSRTRMARGGGKVRKTKPQVVSKAGVEREDGFLYFIDKDGDVARAKMARPGSRKKSTPAHRKENDSSRSGSQEKSGLQRRKRLRKKLPVRKWRVRQHNGAAVLVRVRLNVRLPDAQGDS